MIDHGTTRGYSAHRRRGQAPCSLCKVAENDRKAKWRDARHEAVRKLIGQHPEEFLALLADEKAKRGV